MQWGRKLQEITGGVVGRLKESLGSTLLYFLDVVVLESESESLVWEKIVGELASEMGEERDGSCRCRLAMLA